MIAGTTPVIASVLGAPASAEPAATRADESAKGAFAAMMAAMLNPGAVAATPVLKNISLDALADAEIVDEAVVESEDEATASTASAERADPATTALTSAAVGTDRRVPVETVIEGTRPVAANAVANSPERLDADFSDRLTRVLDRMRSAGHRVEVRETIRSAARQEALYAQGRTTPGPIVTWTRDSRHLEGKAADVIVDGRASGKGYALLQRIATEEGLRTLGARDPGHVELPRTTADARDGAAARRGAGESIVRPLRQGGMLAAPAQVAQVAQIASTARVAVPGAALGSTSSRTRAAAEVAAATDVAAGGLAEGAGAVNIAARKAPTRAANGAANGAANVAADVAAWGERNATVHGGAIASAGSGRGLPRSASPEADPILATVPIDDQGTVAIDGGARDSFREPSREPSRDPSRDASREPSHGASRERTRADELANDRGATDARAAREVRGRRATSLAAFASDVASRSALDPQRDAMSPMGARTGTIGAGAPLLRASGLAAERVAELLAARDARPAGTIGELRLAMDPVRDGLSEVRLALQQGALDATLHTSDAGVARGLRSDVATLSRALERQGFDAARVSVQLDAAQQARQTALDTVSAAEASARARGVRGDSDASLEGREQQSAPDSSRAERREQQRDHQRDQQRDQQYARQSGVRRQRPF